MIFVTVGTQEPFDRLLKIMDRVASELPDISIIAQTPKSSYQPRNMKTYDFLTPDEFNNLFNESELVISHAGMGTIISALLNSKPLVVFPRDAKLKEHRSDHQMSTAKVFKKLNYVHVAFTEEELYKNIFDLVNGNIKSILHTISDQASDSLTNSIRDFIFN